MSTTERQPRITSGEVWLVIGHVLAAGAVVLALWTLRSMIVWAVLGLFLALALAPVVNGLVRRRWPRGLAVSAVFLLAALLLGGLIALFVPMLGAQGRELVDRAPELFEKVRGLGPIRWADDHFQIVEKVRAGVGDQAGNAARPALAFAGGVVHAITGAITIVVLGIFFLMFGEGVLDQALQWLPLARRAHAKTLATRMSQVVSGYMAGTIVVASIGGVVMGTTMAILGVPYFLPLALLMILLGVVPVIGTTVAAVVIVGVTFASAGSTPALVCAGVYLAYQQVENHVLQPIVQTRTLKMNPLLIVLALLVGTGLFGILGALLSLPVAGALKVLLGDVLTRRQLRVQLDGP